MIYAGIGSRQTPQPVLRHMRAIGQLLAMSGHTLRSGKALGADSAFEVGARMRRGRTELFTQYDAHRHPTWLDHASMYHPTWSKLGEIAKLLHGRNSAVMLGPALDTPVRFVVCWTLDAEVRGGTGQALRIAAAHGIPIYNLARWGDDRLMWNEVYR